MEILLGLIGVIIGAVLKWIIPALSEWIRIKKKTKELLGEWHSEYQDIDGESGSWVKEKIKISIPLLTSKLKIKNSDSSEKYDYTAYAQLESSSYLVGNWESIRPASNAYGSFMLTIDSQGICLYGYWSGPDKLGARRFGRWVLSKDKKNIPRAKKILEEMRKSHYINV